MKILFERSGGFAGMTRTTTIDTDNLPVYQVQQLSPLLEAANFFSLPSSINSQSPQNDRFWYTLTVEDNGKSHTVTVSEAALPGTLRPLIDWIQASKVNG
jgi:hypothetical protein